ncbi:MAG: Na+/H+ antiporter subunit E [Acetobacteraceae bacterium]|nr:Na+/H+ antiporter subunit E [Pseudomonadota bacterium]
MALPPAILRASAFLALWVVLAGVHAADLPAAVAAVVAATWVSFRLSPSTGGLLSLPGLIALMVRYPWQSLLAGIDVARLVFAPGLPLRVDTVVYTPRLPPGAARDAFLVYASTLPGTVPVVAADGSRIVIHCLDAAQPVAEQMAAEEARFIRALGGAYG